MSRVVLASASPARLATLRAAGIHPDVVVSGVDESLVRESDPALLVSRLAARKAHAVVERLGADPGPEEPPLRAWVLGCDSVLAFDGEILGRPADAARMALYGPEIHAAARTRPTPHHPASFTATCSDVPHIPLGGPVVHV